jgi:acetyl esterase
MSTVQPVLDPDVQAVLDAMNAAPGPPPHEVPFHLARAAYVSETEHLCGPDEPVAEVRDLAIPGPGGAIPLRAHRPAGDGPLPVVAYLHGGGWVMGDLDTHAALMRALANASGAIVVGVDYRLAPEHPFPAAVEDSVAAVRWLHANAAELGGDGERIAVAGDSAGGNLAAVVALKLRREVPLRLQMLLYPVIDAGVNTPSYREFTTGHGLSAASMRRFWNAYLDGADGTHPDASPVRAEDLSGAAPAYVLTAAHDVLRDEGEAYAEALGVAGVAVEAERRAGTIHGYLRWFAVTAVAGDSVRDLGAALRRALA